MIKVQPSPQSETVEQTHVGVVDQGKTAGQNQEVGDV